MQTKNATLNESLDEQLQRKLNTTTIEMSNGKDEVKNLYTYILLTLAITWLIQIPLIFLSVDANVTGLLVVLGSFGPTVSAVFLVYSKNPRNLLPFIKRGVDFNFQKKYLLAILGLLPGLFVIAGLSLQLLSLISPNINQILSSISVLILFPVMILMGGPIAEEFGWRGYALDRIQLKMNPLKSSLLLGIIHGLWHLPLFFIKGTIQFQLFTNTPFSIIILFLIIVMMSISYTWLHNSCNRSILVALLFHSTFNTVSVAMVVLTSDPNGNFNISSLNYIFVVFTFVYLLFTILLVLGTKLWKNE